MQSPLVGKILLSIAACAVAAAPLVPAETTELLPTVCVFCGPLGGVDFVLNILLFVPLGIGFAVLGRRFGYAVLGGALMTLAIEALQWRAISGRDASLGDLLANTLGAAFGHWLATHVGRWLHATGTYALRLNGACGVLVSVILLGTATSLLPAIPGWPLYVEWTPVRPGTVPFPGRLLSAELNRRPIGSTEWVRFGSKPESLSTGFTVRVSVEAPDSIPRRQAIILHVANQPIAALTLSQFEEDILFRSHALASQLRLRRPVIVLKAVFPAVNAATKDSTIVVEAVSNPRAITISSQRGDETKRVTVLRTVGLGWVLVAPRDFVLNESWWVVNALWLGALVFPISFFMKRASSAGGGVVIAIARWSPAASVVFALVTATVIVGLSAPGPGEVLGMILGASAGWWTERFVAAGHLANLSDTTVEPIEE